MNNISNSISYIQQMRIKRITDTFFLLDKNITDSKIIMKVSGSTYNVYTININRDNGKISCDCIDFRKNCSNKNIFCKHICFVYLKIGLINDNHLFFNYFVSDDNIVMILNRLDNAWQDRNIFSEDLCDKFNKLKVTPNLKESKTSIFDDKDTRNLDDDCPICYVSLSENKINKCPTCKNAVHTECMNMWLKQHDTCVYCRSDIWKQFNEKKKITNSNYLNVS